MVPSQLKLYKSSPEHCGDGCEQELLTDLAFGKSLSYQAVKFEFILTTLCPQACEGLLTSCQVFIRTVSFQKHCAYGPMKAEFIGFSLLSPCHRNSVQSRTVSVENLLESKLTRGDIFELLGAKWPRGKH